MTRNDAIWIGRDGQKFGPYTEAVIRQWLASGEVTPDTLGWRTGMAAWQPLSTFIVMPVAHAPASPPWPPQPSSPAADPYISAQNDARASLPMPPSLHWGLVLLLSLVTFGIFGWVWFFMQASWVKKIDRSSNATTLLVVALVLAFGGGLVSGLMHGSPGVRGLGTLASTVLIIVAFFSMRTSMQDDARGRGLNLAIGGVTLFFFQTLYIQAHMTWLGRWKETGQTTPPPTKGAFYFLLPLFALPILAAIAIPSYQNYIIRAQVSEGVNLGNDAKSAVAGYIARTGHVPLGNAEAGLGGPSSIHGKYVSSVEVAGGEVRVTYADAANLHIRGHQLLMTPEMEAGQVTWRCSSDDIAVGYLPAACR